MANSNRPPQRRTKPAASSVSKMGQRPQQRGKITELRFKRGDDDIWIRLSPRTTRWIIGITSAIATPILIVSGFTVKEQIVQNLLSPAPKQNVADRPMP